MNSQNDVKIECKDLENGPVEERECKDIICLLIFVINVGVMLYCSYFAYYNGNLGTIFRATDPNENICGVGVAYDYPYIYFVDPLSFATSKRVCVKECPTYKGKSNLPHLLCFANSVIGNCSYDNVISENGATMTPKTPGSGGYDIIGYDSYQIIDRICMPSVSTFSYLTRSGIQAVNSFQSLLQQGYLMNLVTDVKNNWGIFLAAIAIAMALSFVIIYLIRCMTGVIVWISIIGAFLALMTLGLLLMYSGGQFGDTNQLFMGYEIPKVGENVQYVKYYGYAVLGVAVVFLIIILCMCSRIRLAVALCQCTGKYLMQVMSSILIPIFMSIIAAILWAVCIVCMLYLVSSSKFIAEQNDVFTSFYSFSDHSLIRFYYFVFGTIWCNGIIGAIGSFLVASSACMWYYSNGPGKDLHLPIMRSLGRVLRYHIGSLAFGSLILAITQFIELLVEVLKQQLIKTGAERSRFVQCMLTCAQCYLACLQKIVIFLNKNAYIQIALRGKNFCHASKDGFEIIWSNPLRFATVGGAGVIIMFIGKLLISSATTAIMWSLFTYSSWSTIISPLLPLLLVFCFSWVISALFMSVYELAMDTLLVCFIVDEANQKIDGRSIPKYAPQQLISLLDQ